MAWQDLAVPLVAQFEGCEKRIGALVVPYIDKLARPPVWTRGYGRTYGIDKDSGPITLQEAREELAVGLTEYGMKCVALAPALAERDECLAAVASWAWNCGVGAFRASRLRRAINAGRWQDAIELIKKPDTAGGVVLKGLRRRRTAESALFAAGVRSE